MNRLDDIFAVILTLAMLGVGFVMRPERARCPLGESVEGVRPSGASWCVRTPDTEVNCAGARACHDTAPLIYRPVKIYCTGGMHPIVVDERTIGCQR